MDSSGAFSSDPKGKRPMAQNELETLENDRVKRIKHEVELEGISYEDYEVMVAIEETDLIEKQNTEDELLARALAEQLEEDEADLIKRQIADDEMLAKALAQLEDHELPKGEDSISSTPVNPRKREDDDDDEEDEDPSVQPLTRRTRDVAEGSHMPGSRSDRTPNS